MSDGSGASTRILEEPLRTIGAQDLLKVGYTFYGHLRRQRKLEKLIGSKRWPRKFVVISQGCVYCYSDEYAKSPLSAFSLSIYESTEALVIPSVLNCFQLKPKDGNKTPPIFACESEDKRKEWMAQMTEAIAQTRDFCCGSPGGSPEGSDEGICVTMPRTFSSKPKLPPVPTTPNSEGASPQRKVVSEYDMESDDVHDEQEPYDDIVDFSEPTPVPTPRTKLALPGMTNQDRPLPSTPSAPIDNRFKLPLPPTTSRQKDQGGPSVAPQTEIGNEPSNYEDPEDYINTYLYLEEEYLFESNDRAKATGLLQEKPAGTFLVRQGRTGPGKVLSVQTNTHVREFKITEKDGEVSLDGTSFFKDIGEMVGVYTKTDLPKKELNQKLLKGYKSQ